MTNKVLETILSGKVVAEFIEVSRNLQIQRSFSVDETIPIVDREQARAVIVVLEHIQECIRGEICQTSAKELLNPPPL